MVKFVQQIQLKEYLTLWKIFKQSILEVYWHEKYRKNTIEFVLRLGFIVQKGIKT